MNGDDFENDVITLNNHSPQPKAQEHNTSNGTAPPAPPSVDDIREDDAITPETTPTKTKSPSRKKHVRNSSTDSNGSRTKVTRHKPSRASLAEARDNVQPLLSARRLQSPD
eukprot:CAMPEP_0172509486 /NCGR_PEP_ID=MMETSP1066-20121228/220686_1 /TAXON_ID=671091 /ORGANISM="Coscinodiscus wailesii, Strain CCMP2513" /LENGTH=110 /DNA_ID=CAMNT_0013287983 /DNA_START=64 /DNA_END=393 /DNA_ORIENTATION=+